MLTSNSLLVILLGLLFLVNSAQATVEFLVDPITSGGEKKIQACWAYHTFYAGSQTSVLTKRVIDRSKVSSKDDPCQQTKPKSLPGIASVNACAADLKKLPGYLMEFQCDEFPPMATEESTASASTMCIPGRSNGSGGQWHQALPAGEKFYYKLAPKPDGNPYSKEELAGLCWSWMLETGVVDGVSVKEPADLKPVMVNKGTASRPNWVPAFSGRHRKYRFRTAPKAQKLARENNRLHARDGKNSKGKTPPPSGSKVIVFDTRGKKPSDVKAWYTKVSALFDSAKKAISGLASKVGNALSKKSKKA